METTTLFLWAIGISIVLYIIGFGIDYLRAVANSKTHVTLRAKQDYYSRGLSFTKGKAYNFGVSNDGTFLTIDYDDRMRDRGHYRFYKEELEEGFKFIDLSGKLAMKRVQNYR